MDHFKPWISDEGPKPPEGWGLDVVRNNNNILKCDSCGKPVKAREQYVYSFKGGLKVLHNTKECSASIIS